MPAADLLFVYGTLRRGGSNHIARIAPDAVFVTTARVRGHLYDVNGRWPALVLDESAGWVAGEIYHLPPPSWPALDALEDPVTPTHPDGAYFKVEAQVECGDRSEPGSAHGTERVTLYTANPAMTRLSFLISSGDWIAYAATLN